MNRQPHQHDNFEDHDPTSGERHAGAPHRPRADSAAPPPRVGFGRFLFRFMFTAALGVTAMVVAYLMWSTGRPLHTGDEIFEIPRGTGVSYFARMLHEAGVTPEPYSLIALAYIRDDIRSIKAGEYRFDEGASLRDILTQVVEGRVVHYPFTLIEGWTSWQMLDALRRASKLQQTLDGVSVDGLMAHLGHPDLHPEGQFYPDTYLYTRGTTDISILRAAFDRMQREVAAAWELREDGIPISTPEEMVILASIIEREAGAAGERGVVSGVFVNRLRTGMRLQTDPTVIYGLGADFTGRLRRVHLDTDTPYNTYTRGGLPPTPIAMPSAASLRAAVQPSQTPYFYFVSRNDGSHVFSETLEQHNRAVARYQLGRDVQVDESPRYDSEEQ